MNKVISYSVGVLLLVWIVYQTTSDYKPTYVDNSATTTINSPYVSDESCEDYTARIKKETAEVMARGFTDYHVVDADKYECANELLPTYTPTPTHVKPEVSPNSFQASTSIACSFVSQRCRPLIKTSP